MDEVSEDHLNPTDEITLDTVKNRATKGILALTGRTLVLRVIAFVAQGFLWAFLDPDHFGTFLVVSAIVNFLSYFADIGLGAALIQKKEKPSEDDYKTVFFVQELLVISISIILIVVTPWIVRTQSLTLDGRNLLYALTAAFFLASLKNIPSIKLERQLDFGKFVIPQILEDLVYNVSVVYFAWRGFGITSFSYAVLIRGVVGLVAIYSLQPWKPGFALAKNSLRGLLKFGVPYQLNNFLATIKDDGLTIVLGSILGTASLGILGTAQRLSQYPLRFFMDNVTKVTFPAFSRMQDDRAQLARALTRSIFFICSLVFPSLVGLVVLFPALIAVIPKYQKWEPAFTPLIYLALSSALASFTTQLTNTLNATGKIKITFKLMIMWTSLSWLLIPVMSMKYGVNGSALAYLLVGTSSFVAVYIAKRYVSVNLTDSVGKPLLASVIMGTTLFLIVTNITTMDFLKLALSVSAGCVTYAVSLYFLVGKSLVDDVKKTITSIASK